MLNLVFLPATEPGDETYGVPPERIVAYPGVVVRHVSYQTLVWYNEKVRAEAVAQIVSSGLAPVVLVGFSKSGLGAWNIARTIPDLVSGTVIFDAPVARREMCWADAAPFYDREADWLADLPIRTVPDFQAVIPRKHRLVLISGEAFHDEMALLSQTLFRAGAAHMFLSRPDMKHHWNSGWIEEGLAAVTDGAGKGEPDVSTKEAQSWP